MISFKSNSTPTNHAAKQISAVKEDGLGANFNAATDMQKLGGAAALSPGAGNIGEALNKMADPNWTDPAKKRVGNKEMDKDAFMKLMLTQMKNQDPTNPMQSHEMAAQLAQFTSLEQLQNVNSSLKNLVDIQGPNTQYQALQMIGKSVKSDSSLVTHLNGEKNHDIRFDLKGDAQTVEVVIKNSDGETVRNYKLANLKPGIQSIKWNAETNDGLLARQGDYKVFINAKDANDKTIITNTTIDGKITGVNFTSQGPVLLIGNQSVPLKDVKRIEEPQDESKNVTDVTNMDLKKDVAVDDNNKKGASPEKEKAVQPPKGNIQSVPMESALLNQVKKQAQKL